ncbi:EcsC family protein [Salirhabdus sp. Marseille-P4669]|uniref:EcsC family protein n=1 Tax=Salirhabdus sp. Marseille-P4669 TaxID=2042310 RepID=UPI000C79A481|nr:EcsC family protein [Salirhabdus sp. Marseille-P4669]
MVSYEEKVLGEALRWKHGLARKSSIIQKASKSVQTKINEKIPDKVHAIITESIRKMMETTLTSSAYIYKINVNPAWSFEKREEVVLERLHTYRNTAILEGAGTGAGGIMLGLADFPLLLSIKMKFLFDAGQLYGMNVKAYEERMFLLHVFMLAFSSDNSRKKVLERVMNWEREKDYWKEIDWRELQQEYRDTIDFVKMLQLVPGIGAVIGAWANNKLLNQLGETTMNSFRLRILA